MIYEIYTENGTKKKRALTGDGYGLPLGSIIAVYSNLVPDGYLPCNGAVYDTTTYAALYAYLGSNRLPDLRECNLVGAGQSDNDYNATSNPNGIQAHDIYTVGQFKDDQMQGHYHNAYGGSGDTHGGVSYAGGYNPSNNNGMVRWAVTDGTNGEPRVGTTTHGKQVGVNYCIKATPAYVEPDTVSDMVNTLRTQDSYSTSEVNTGKKWIDGKPIYRKTYVGDPVPLSVITTLSAFEDWNIPIPANAETLVKSEVRGFNSIAKYYSFFFASASICFNNATGNLTLWSGSNTGTVKQATIYYTKSTD